jgi:hypothetical protein
MDVQRSWPALALAAVLPISLGLAAAAPKAARAAFVEVGQEVRNAIDVRAGRKIPLPPGRWRVEAAFEETIDLDTRGVSVRSTLPEYNVVLANDDKQADVALLVVQFTDSATVSWSGQPCDVPQANAPLLSNSMGTTANSLNIRCSRIFAYDHFRRAVHQASTSSPTWQGKRFGPLSSRSAEMPVHTLVGAGYLSAHRGNRVWVRAYANPALHGLEAAPDGGPVFRNPDKLGDRAELARKYLKTFAEWFDGYVGAVHQQYLEGRAAEVPKFAFGDARPSVVAAASPSAQVPAAAPPGPAPAAPAPAAPAKPPPVPLPSVHALVIGNAAYKGAPLRNPANDARAVAQRLRSYGFVVTLLLDATRKQLVDSLTRFAETARRADVTIVFYAGHGVQLHGVNYLVPVDLDLAGTKALGLTYEAVSLNTLLEEHLPGRARLVFLDACRDNPLARSLAATRGSSSGLAPMNAAAGTLISYATRDGSTASDGSGPNSPYTTALLAHLDEAEDISIVLRRVRQRVMDSTRGTQQPWEYGSLTGDKLVLSQISRPR